MTRKVSKCFNQCRQDNSRVLNLGEDVFSLGMATTKRVGSEVCNESKKFKTDEGMEHESAHDVKDYGKVHYHITENEEIEKDVETLWFRVFKESHRVTLIPDLMDQNRLVKKAHENGHGSSTMTINKVFR